MINDVTPPEYGGQKPRVSNKAVAPAKKMPFFGRPKKSSGKPRHENWRSALTTIAILIAAPLFALFLTAYVFQTYQVEGPSMEPTLHPSDRLIVWKMPQTWGKITGNAHIPDRGDIVIFTEPGLNRFGQEPSKQLIKRVIALPGERVVVENGSVIVYNEQNPGGFRPDLELGHSDTIGTTPGELNQTVPEEHIFVLGDNRVNSLDSRSFGPVHYSNIIGDLAARVLPLNQAQRF